MKIETLSLKNWRSHRATEFKFGPINLIRGLNNAGKSSVAQALEYLLTGRCLGTDERGSGADAFIALGTKEAAIKAHIGVNNGLQVLLERTRTARGGNLELTQTGNHLVGKAAEDFLEKWGYDKALVSAALRAGRFIDLKEAEQKELLADLLKPDPIDLPAEILTAMRLVNVGIAPNGLEGVTISLDLLRFWEKYATTHRAECTAALREIGEPEPVAAADPQAPTAAECLKRLDQLRAEQNGLSREKASRQAKWGVNQAVRRVANETLGRKKELLDRETENKYLAAIEHRAETDRAQAELDRVHFQISELNGEILRAEKAAGKCPTCGHETDTEELVKRYQDAQAAARSRIPGLESTATKYPPITLAEEALRKHRAAIVEIDQAKRTLADTPNDPEPDTSDLEAKLKEIEERIVKGQAITTGTFAAEAARETYAGRMKQRQRLEERRAAADLIAKWASPNDAQASMTAGKLGPFTAALNQTLKYFCFELSLTLEPYALVVNGKTPRQLSASEQYRLSVALQTAFARISGLNLAVFDGADILTGANRPALARALSEAGLEQVFILASVQDRTPTPPGVSVFDLTLKDGVTQLEAKT